MTGLLFFFPLLLSPLIRRGSFFGVVWVFGFFFLGGGCLFFLIWWVCRGFFFFFFFVLVLWDRKSRLMLDVGNKRRRYINLLINLHPPLLLNVKYDL